MRLGKELTGKPIISITNGRIIGTVKDLYINGELSWLAGIHLGSEGLLKRKSLLIQSDKVVVYGIDAILVKSDEVTTDDHQFPAANNWIKLSKLRGREVDTPGGTKVGSIGDIQLGEKGHIIGFTLSRVFVDGPVADQGQIPREAMLDTGNEDGIMTIDLPRVENQTVAKQPDSEQTS